RIILLLAIDDIATGDWGKVNLTAGLVGGNCVLTFVDGLHESHSIHSQKVINIKLSPVNLSTYLLTYTDPESFIEAKFNALDQDLQALRVILNVERLNIVICRHLTDANLVWRNVESRAYDLCRPLQLLDQLSVISLHRQCFKLQTISQHSDFTGVRSRIVGVPIFLKASGIVRVNLTRSHQQSSRARTVPKEADAILLNG